MLPSNQSELLIAYSHVITHAAGFIFYFRKLTATLCLSFLEVENVSEKCPQVQKAGMSSKIVQSPLQFFIISILNHSKKTDFIFASYEIKKMDLITTYSFPCFLPYSDIHFVEHFNGLKIKKKNILHFVFRVLSPMIPGLRQCRQSFFNTWPLKTYKFYFLHIHTRTFYFLR